MSRIEIFDGSTSDAVACLTASLQAKADYPALAMFSRGGRPNTRFERESLARTGMRAEHGAVGGAQFEKVPLRVNVNGVGERVGGVQAGVASSVDMIARAGDVVTPTLVDRVHSKLR